MDLSALEKQIKKRKSEMMSTNGNVGSTQQTTIGNNNDNFIAKLLESAKTGRKNEATEHISKVAKVAEKKANKEEIDQALLESNVSNESKAIPQQKNQAPNQRPQPPKLQNFGGTPNTQNNSGMFDAINQFNGQPMPNTTQQPQSYISEQEMMLRKQQGMVGNQTINQNALNEQVIKMTSEILNENFGELFSTAFKESIVETYKAERVKKALDENKQMIKDIVIETILELQKRSKSK